MTSRPVILRPSFQASYDSVNSIGGSLATTAVAHVKKSPAPTLAIPHRQIDKDIHRAVTELSADVDALTIVVASAPDIGRCFVSGVPMISGQTCLVNHSLGRPYIGWRCARAVGAAWSGHEPSTPPQGTDPSRQLALIPGSTGTFSFEIF